LYLYYLLLILFSAAAVVPAGWGMTLNRATGLFTANECPKDTYGSSETTYGLMFIPCKPCAKGLLTTGAGMTSADDCVNPPGYGWDGFVANVCPAGFHSASGKMLRCEACPLHRNTTSSTPPFNDAPADLPLPGGTGLDQDDVTDCKVIAGHGVTGFTPPLSSLTLAQKVALDVQECEQGTYSVGGAVDSECIPCSAGADGTLGAYSTTRGTSSISPMDCSGKGHVKMFCSIPRTVSFEQGYCFQMGRPWYQSTVFGSSSQQQYPGSLAYLQLSNWLLSKCTAVEVSICRHA
jgi:hypothetical protein